jgi:hypothetical protein
VGLFRRKQAGLEDDSERCPRCRERVPDGAVECMMCGLALAPVRVQTSQERAEARRGEPATE